MGVIIHDTIIVTGQREEVDKVHARAKKLFNKKIDDGFDPADLVSDVVLAKMNSFASFFIAPDGSKEGWPESDLYDGVREKFIRYLDAYIAKGNYVDYVVVRFGPDLAGGGHVV